MEAHEKQLRAELMRLLAERRLPFSDLNVEYDPDTDELVVSARCTDDPLFAAPHDSRGEDGAWNHRRIEIEIRFMQSQETDRAVLSTTVTYAVDATHANYSPLPDNKPEVRVSFNWEFDAADLSISVAELRDGDRLHYFSVRPSEAVCRFVAACADSERIVGEGV